MKMKKTIFSLVTSMFVAGSLLSGCTSQDKKMENAEQNVQDAKSDVVEAKQDLTVAQQGEISEFQKFKNESIEEINKNYRRIAYLRIEMKNEKSESR